MLEWLQEILGDGYTQEIDNKVSEAIGRRFVSKTDFNAKSDELKGVRQQLTDANATIEGYRELDIDGIRQSVADWETKYNTDTQALQDQLEATRYGHAVEQAISGLKFSSESARKAFTADLTAKKLPMENGTLLGLDDFTTKYKEADPGAFATEGSGYAFTTGSSGKSGAGGDNPFTFQFTGVR